jgi:uncharacterized protein with PIN domain
MNLLEPAQIVLAEMGSVGIFLIFIAIIVAVFLFRSRCRNCKRFLALRSTGNTRREGGKFFGTNYQEWLCRHCGHRVWKQEQSGGGGGGNGG